MLKNNLQLVNGNRINSSCLTAWVFVSWSQYLEQTVTRSQVLRDCVLPLSTGLKCTIFRSLFTPHYNRGCGSEADMPIHKELQFFFNRSLVQLVLYLIIFNAEYCARKPCYVNVWYVPTNTSIWLNVKVKNNKDDRLEYHSSIAQLLDEACLAPTSLKF